MDKTTLNEQAQKKNKISAKKAEEIKVSAKIAAVLKREWEDLAKKQEQRGVKVSAGRKISSVTLVKNRRGKISVRVNMENGGRLFDNAKEKHILTFKEKAQKAYSRAKVEEFLKKIKEYGYAAVEGEIPAELKEAVLKGMARANISTSYKGERAEAAANRDALQNLSPATNSNFANDAGPGLFAGTAAAAFGFAAANKAIRVQDGYIFDGSGNKILSSPEVEALLNRGVAIYLNEIPPNVPEKTRPLIEELAGKVVQQGTQNLDDEDILAVAPPPSGSRSFTVQTKDGRILKGSVDSSAVKNTLQKQLLGAVDALQNGKNETAQQILNSQLSVLKHNNVIPRDATEVPLDKLEEVKAFFRTNSSQIKEKGLIQYLPEEAKKKYFEEKAKEKANTANSEQDIQQAKKIRKEIAKQSTLISQGINGKIDLQKSSFKDIYHDLKIHRKEGYPNTEEEKTLSALLFVEQRKKGLTSDSKIPADVVQKTTELFREYQEKKKENSGLAFQTFLEKKGIFLPQSTSQKGTNSNTQGKTQGTPQGKAHGSSQSNVGQKQQTKEELLAPDNAVSAEKIRQAKAVLDKEAKGEPLCEKEQNLLTFVHRTFAKVPDLKKEDLDDPKNKNQLAEMLKCKKHFSNLPKENIGSSEKHKQAGQKQPVQQQPVKAQAEPKQPVEQQLVKAQAGQKQSQQAQTMTEKERVISKIKENMEAFKNTSEPTRQSAQKQENGKKNGLQSKIQQKQTSKAPARQNTLSPGMQAALINKKERE